jgi:methylated-DNA-[protein]-cysteine S-methyltransferase
MMNASSGQMKSMKTVFYTTVESPVGTLLLAGDAQSLRSLSFEKSKRAERVQSAWKEDKAPFAEVIRQLRAYFGGKLKEFDVPLALEGTEFQLSVWRSLRTIPYGETISYGQLAQRIGNP